MLNSDQTIINWVEAQRRSIGDLFLIQDQVYWSTDAGDFQAASTYRPYQAAAAEDLNSLATFLRRLGAPRYESSADVDDEINLHKEWERLYNDLIVVLERHGKLDPFGDGDYYLVEDCYASPQHKVECTTNDAYTQQLVFDVQSLLKNYARCWEVIFALPPVEGRDHAFSVYADRCIEHFGAQYE